VKALNKNFDPNKHKLSPEEQEIEDAIGSGFYDDVINDKSHPVFIRTKLGMNQRTFAETFGIPLRTLQNWEIGRRKPDQAALTLLKAIALHPEAIRDAASVAG